MNEKTLPPTLDWADLPLFLAIAREGTLTGAAKISGKSPATLSRRMLDLERRLGKELLIRHDRGYALTDEGRAFADALGTVEQDLVQLIKKPEDDLPLVKLSAGSWTSLDLIRALPAILGTPPEFRLRLIADEARLSLSHREISLGIRAGRPTEEGLAGKRLRRVYFAPYALEKSEKRWLNTTLDTPSARWVAERAGAFVHLEASTARSLLDMALAGLGKAMLPDFVARHYPELVRSGQMVPELSHDQWLVMHDDDRHLPAQRRAIDRIVSALRGD
ncbi:LysR family transcriptional regulator [Paracoccaceae bacterium GXU_MW_L88]